MQNLFLYFLLFSMFAKYTFFFYKQVFYKQPQAQIAKNLSTLLSTLSASDLE